MDRLLLNNSDPTALPVTAAVMIPTAANATTAATVAAAAKRGSLAAAAQAARMYLVFFLLGFVVIWLLSVVLVMHLRFNRAAARKGNESAARKIILPAFEPLLAVLASFNALFILLLSIALATNMYAMYVPPVVLETLYSAHQLDTLLPLVFMLQRSVSIPALRRAFALAFVLSGYTIPYIWLVMTHGNPAKQTTYVAWLHPLRAIALLLSVYVFIWPPSRASTRTLRELAVYNIVRYALTTVHMVLQMNATMRPNAKYVLFTSLAVVVLNPFVIWRVLKADTGYWRGMGDRAVALQSLFKQNHHMHEGVSSEGLHLLIELHRKHIIDFALLELRLQIGVGTTSTVFRGVLRAKTRVAVKVYHPSSFTDDVVAGFSHEAALCGLLHHPNIVTFHGMCVAPPAICLVFELCQGSLQDVMRVNARRPYAPVRQQLLIDVGYMLDAARAVAYIHSFSPPFIHRDIKPENFLVDVDCCVKLADFGESRALGQLAATAVQAPPPRQSLAATFVARASAKHDRAKAGVYSYRPSVTATDMGSMSPLDDGMYDEQSNMTVKGTADYMAPEVINGRGGVACYDEAADVYSLAITMWDILNPVGDHFGDTSHLHVFERVLRGVRPVLDSGLPRRLRDVIERAWDGDARRRPSARAIVAVLEEVQESLSAASVTDILDELQLSLGAPEGSLSTGTSASAIGGVSQYSGAAVADALVERQYVASIVEATRMGNAWMDAGLLHHNRHARAFECSATAHYFFDVNANATLRLALETARHSDPANSIPMLSANEVGRHHQHQHQHRPHHILQLQQQQQPGARESSASAASVTLRGGACACQKLAQRRVDETAWRHFRRKPLGVPRATVTDDMVLTTALLMHDEDGDDLEAFADRGCSVVRASHA